MEKGVQKMKKSANLKVILALTAAAAAFSLTGCNEGDDISISPKSETTTAAVTETEAITETVTEATTEETEATSETTEKADASSSDDQDDEEYKKELLDMFTENVEDYDMAFSMSNDFGIQFDAEAGDVIWMDLQTNEILKSGGNELKNSNDLDYSAHPAAFFGFALSDSRFSNLDEYNDYLKTVFTSKFLDVNDCGRRRFVEYEGKYYITELNKGLLFENWFADEAEITEFEKDKSFTVLVPGIKFDNPEDDLYGTLKFVKEADGWKIDDIQYNNLTNSRFN